ncbi:MAG TPA: dihydroorotate dehydrogenase (quinone) [Lentisphaeria bacterium]|nr:dihydroorotate dehydrogenase (quinone) [Lentisphaeria bacterium]|tara:strand:- start:2340 stop:3377 length:1038 start_codon:yes stop_codon:yes gene_type:complete
MLYKIAKPFLFLMAPETAHHFVFGTLRLLFLIPGIKAYIRSRHRCNDLSLRRTLFGLEFPNPVGLAAGFDKNAEFLHQLDAFGFGFVEIGTVTPKAQPGNPRPRLFRLPSDDALINRMGFNNHGVDAVVQRLRSRPSGLIVGGNIGRNKVTPNDRAAEDYEICFNALYDHVDFFTINVSSPNTPGLRELQGKEPLTALLNRVQALNRQKPVPKPVLLKIAPDLTDTQLDDIVETALATKLAGLIATNTTVSRENLRTPQSTVDEIGDGGVSGVPLRQRSTEVIRYLAERLAGRLPVIGVGGIHSPADAIEKLEAGAALVQVYTGFVYSGAGLAKSINEVLVDGAG